MNEAFEAWWKEMKPAEVDDLKNWFYECWQEAQAFERQQCAKVARGCLGAGTIADAILERGA